MSTAGSGLRLPLAIGAAVLLLVAGFTAGLLAARGSGDDPAPPGPSATGAPPGSPTPLPTPDSDPVVVISGDIGVSASDDTDTAALVEQVDPDVVLTSGDNAYSDGTESNYAEHYDPDWGRFKAITRPSPGNHDYHDEAGDPPYYYTYFADQLPAENDGQYYAFDLGGWRLYSLNCEIDCSAGSPQVAWLREDLATNGEGKNKLAYLHRPRYSCGANHGSESRPVALWDELIEAGSDVVVAGHDHNYQRFPRMDSGGNLSPDGLASFVVGTGGNGLYTLGSGYVGCEHLAFGQDTAFGVLKLTLGDAQYSWEFLATDDSVADSGTAPTLGSGGSGSSAGATAGATASSAPGTGVLEATVASGADDAEERPGGGVSLDSSDLELTTDRGRVQTVGIRFPEVPVPAGATVTAAYVQFQTDEVSTGPAQLTLAALASDDAARFTPARGNLSGRVRTAARVSWSPPEWPTRGARGPDQRTPDLARLVQEVVDRPGWASGQALAFVVTGTGTRTATAFDGTSSPVLHVEYRS